MATKQFWQPEEPFPFLSWEAVPEEQRVFVDDLPLFDNLMLILFQQLSKRLTLTGITLEIHHIEKEEAEALPKVDGYAGVPKKIILTINDVFRPSNDEIAMALIHEILHKKNPKYGEMKIVRLSEEKWRELYPTKPIKLVVRRFTEEEWREIEKLKKELLHSASTELAFSRRVLGGFASMRLEAKKVTQTIRSDKEIAGISVGDVVDVTLDYVPIGKAKIVSIDKVRLSDLGREDAEKGGFEGIVDELRKALMRAGFRFRPLEEYFQNRVRFEWCKA